MHLKTLSEKINSKEAVIEQSNTIGNKFIKQYEECLKGRMSIDTELQSLLCMEYSGDDNKTVRQSLAYFLTGDLLPISKCGIGNIQKYTNDYITNLKKYK